MQMTKWKPQGLRALPAVRPRIDAADVNWLAVCDDTMTARSAT
jgi:hypothetical protein